MYFKKLELIGFKSFADKTVLHFEPGVTAIVGPNGCGKSNVFDAIRWVLGEQSVKAMRGSSMEDVIFNGTASKPALGFAEVSLTFSNENKLFALDYEEITITRRLFRSGESEYLINKGQVRLKDINELLMGTGIASEAYSLVEQGKIDLVLSSRPEERRSIFDEAAGITKYKSKKKEALNKLKDTEDNLLRISDIIDEVRRQIGSVERQAAKARRYQENFERLKAQEIKIGLHGLAQFFGELQNLSGEKENSKAKLRGLDQNISGCIKEMEELQSELNDIIADIEAADRDILKADNIAGRFSDQITVNRERIEEHKRRGENLAKENKIIVKRIDEEGARLEAIKQELSSFDSVAQEKQNKLKIKNVFLEKIAQDTDAARKLISESRKAILNLTNQLTVSRNETLKINTGLTTLSARRRRLQLENAKVTEEKQQYDANFEGKNSQLQGLVVQVDSMRSVLDKEKKDLEKAEKTLKEFEDNLANLEKELLNLQSHKEFLLSLKTKYSDFSDTTKGEIFLDAQNLKAGMGFLGKIESVSESAGLSKDIGISAKSVKRISCHLKIIDLDLERIVRRETELSSSIAGQKAKRQDMVNAVKSGLNLVAGKEKELRELEMNLSNIKTQVDIIEQDAKRLEEELAIVDQELGEVSGEASILEKSLEKARIKNESLETEIKESENLISSSQDLISKLTEEREKTVVDITQLQTSFSSLADNRISLEASIKIVESSLSQDTDKQADIERQGQDCKQRVEQLLGQIEQSEKEIEEAKKSEEGVLLQLEKLRKEREAFSLKIKDKQAAINEQTQAVDLARQSDFQISSKEQEINYKILNLKNRLDSTYHVNLDSPGQAPALIAGEELAVLEADIKTLKEKLDSYGAVNLVAIEEYEELKKRFEFLTNQQNDLIAAKDSIHQAISKINQTTRKMFVQTFEKIQENFKAYFRLLFNGGDAQLFLIDENDVLESGIEIVCRPPGKKLQNISLLSGGEKSLSAIALVFAVFKVKPSPFCVLDEIDAALDESNIDRYNRVLQEFLKTTQFITITHNKKTITNADVMYGITMQESGISKVVSVKFAKDKAAKNFDEKETPALEEK